MIRRFFSLVIVIALSLTAVLAQQPASTTPSADHIRQVIEYLASDALEGRRTGTRGANDAAQYVAAEFYRLGLQSGLRTAYPERSPLNKYAHYLQAFPYVSSVELGKKNLLFVNPGRADDTAQFLVGEDWMPLGFSSNGSVENTQIVYVGFGITASELKYDDYAKFDVKDKVALANKGTPDGDNPHGRFARFEDIRFKAIAAREHGAKALLIVARERAFKDDRLSRPRYDNAGVAGIPVVVVSQSIENKLHRLPRAGGFEGSYETLVQLVNKEIEAARVSFSTDIVRHESPSFNVVGILPGSDPKLKDEAIVIGAHYDHLGRGGEGSLAPREGDIHHGADDNASGVAGVLELARIFSTQTPKPRRTIVFIAFSGEEEGLIGSNYYVNHPVVPLASTVAMINMDMIGRLKDEKLIVGGVGTAQEWRSMIQSNNSLENMRTAAITEVLSAPATVNIHVNMNPAKAPPNGFPIVIGANGQPVVIAELPKLPTNLAVPFSLTLNEDGFGPSDHSSFYAKQVPVLFFWTGTHDDYHKPSDTADKINYEGEARIVSFVARVVHDIDNSDKRPTYTVAKTESQGRSTGFRVYLGTIPNYAETNDGLKLDGVRDNSPAAKAGLKAGDKIVKLAGREVKNVYDYTYALGEMKAGQEYEVEIIRDGQRMTLKITPEARK